MSNIVHLLAKGSDLSNIGGTVGLLCELATDNPWVHQAEHCYGQAVLLGSADAALAEAYPLVSKLLQNSPTLEGFQPLRVFEESLLEQFAYIAQAVHLDRWISERGFSQCCFASYSVWLDRLRAAREVTGSRYEIVAELSFFESSAHRRAVRRLWDSRPTAAELGRRVIPLWARRVSGLSKTKITRSVRRGGIWFYSTAYNFTKIGLECEPYLPERMNYLVEDPATGGKRLREAGRDGFPLYAWSRRADIPSASEVRSMGEAITAAVSAVPLSEKESILRTVFLKSEFWRLFLTRRLPFLVFNSRALQRWYESVAPKMILVGNAGYERALLLHENVRQVPVVMLQHGIMHWVYAVTDEPVDVFVVRGPFFQRCINETFRRKTTIQNLPEPKTENVPNQAGIVRDRILFITAPYEAAEFFHDEDRRDILRSLLRASHSTGRRLVIRVHPMEKVSAYEKCVAELQRDLGLQTEVSYSQGPGVEDVLARSCMAVLYFSTMFLDCLRHSIPIVSLGWHWFPNKHHFEAEGIFNFASDLKDLETMIKKGVSGDLPRRCSGLEQFLAATEPSELTSFFRDIWDSRKSQGVHHLTLDCESGVGAGDHSVAQKVEK